MYNHDHVVILNRYNIFIVYLGNPVAAPTAPTQGANIKYVDQNGLYFGLHLLFILFVVTLTILPLSNQYNFFIVYLGNPVAAPTQGANIKYVDQNGLYFEIYYNLSEHKNF